MRRPKSRSAIRSASPPPPSANPCRAAASEIHVFDPLADIGRRRGEGQSRYAIKRNIEPDASRKTESLDDQNHRRKAYLHRRVQLRYYQRLDLHRLPHDEGNHEGAYDHHIAGDDQDRDRRGQHRDDGKRYINRYDKRLVGHWVEIGAEFGGKIESLGDPAIDGVGKSGDDENDASLFPSLRGDHRDNRRHEHEAPERYQIRQIAVIRKHRLASMN